MSAWLRLVVLGVAVGLGAAADASCTSEMKGDFPYKTCASFCKSSRAATHCRYCKCQNCTFCTSGARMPMEQTPARTPLEQTPARTPLEQTPARMPLEHTPARMPLEHTPAVPQPAGAAQPAAQLPPLRPGAPVRVGQAERSRRVGAAAAATAAPVRAPAQPTATATKAPPSGAPHLRAWVPLVFLVLSVGIGCYYFVHKTGDAHERHEGGALLSSGSGADKANREQYTSDDALLPQEQGEEFRPRSKSSRLFLGASLETVEQVRVRTLCVMFLCLQYSVYALLRRYSTGILKEDWGGSSVLGVGEAIKFCISLVMIGTQDKASDAPPAPLHLRVRWLLANSIKMAVPALVYLTMNMLGFASLHRIDAGTFAVVQQSKVFFTALFLRIFLGRRLSLPKWCALVGLVLGVLLISLESHPAKRCDAPDADAAAAGAGAAGRAVGIGAAALVSYSVGLVAVTLDSMLSGFATVYFEMVLKSTTLTVWDRNLQLAVYSMAIYIPWAIWEHPTDPFHGWSRITLLVSLLGALGGILVAMVIKYADGIAKNLSTASSIVITAAVSHYLFDGPMNTPIVIGSMVVIVSGFNYQNVQ